MRISDWSSDVCSSDLRAMNREIEAILQPQGKAVALFVVLVAHAHDDAPWFGPAGYGATMRILRTAPPRWPQSKSAIPAPCAGPMIAGDAGCAAHECPRAADRASGRPQVCPFRGARGCLRCCAPADQPGPSPRESSVRQE